MSRRLSTGLITGTYRHELRIYLSEEHPTEDALYRPNASAPSGGEIRIFVHNVASLSEPERIATLAHELVHLFTDVILGAQQFTFGLRASQPPLPGAAAGGRPVSVSVALADVTLGAYNPAFRGAAGDERRLRFESQKLALHHSYRSVINFLNQQRAARGAAALDPDAVSGRWVARTADELLAYTSISRWTSQYNSKPAAGRAAAGLRSACR